MEYRQRRLVAAGVLVASLLLVGYLIFFTPSESTISTPTPANTVVAIFTQLPSEPESDEKRTAEAGEAEREVAQATGIEDSGGVLRTPVNIPDWMSRVESNPVNSACPETAVRTVEVTNATELTNALDTAQPGDRISLASGRYDGNFELSNSGEQGKRIWICGPRDAVLDAGGPSNGFGLHITGSYAGVWGLTVSNAKKGIVVDGGDQVQIDYVEVHTIGEAAIHFQANATDGVIQDSLIHYTGLLRDDVGEGIVTGSAFPNWGETSGGDPDKSDGIVISRNRIWDTTAEAIDVKEGTTGGRIDFNSFDGSSLTGADSWVDIKGNGYLIQGNVGTTSPEDGFQTHNIDDMGWGSDNQFVQNTAQVSGPGYGIYIHDPEETNNIVSCSNIVIAAESGMSNLPCEN